MRKDYKHFLLVYGHMRTGGIETLIVRMANWLVSSGNKVTILLQESGELLELLDKKIDIEILDSKKNLFYLPFFGKNCLQDYQNKDIDIIYSFGPEACYFASFVFKYGFSEKRPIFINGIYHPSEFALDGGISALDKFRIDLYNDYVSDAAKIFMSEEVRSGNERILGTQIPKSLIWPLPIDDTRFHNIARQVIPFRIVSIGRLAKFKTYNIYMFDVLEELLKNGYNVTWDVYGSGPLEDDMKKNIRKRKLSKRVFMHGILTYENYAKALIAAHVFVGMGSSLIETGFCRVPCVPAIANDRIGLTYGSLYNLPYYACGEVLSDDFKTYTVTSTIRKIFDMTETEYETESKLTFQYVQPYSIDKLMKKFVEYAETAPKIQNIESYPGWKYVVYWVKWIYAQARKKISLRRRLQAIIFQCHRGT